MKTLANELCKSRNKRKLTIEQAAIAMGLPKSSLCDYENGKINNPTVLMIYRMAKCYAWSANKVGNMILNDGATK